MAGVETDYTNVRFKQLQAIKVVRRIQHGRNSIKVWLCICNCGNTLEVDQSQLTKGAITACKTCRREPCVVCGSLITDDSSSVKRNTCDEVCKKELVRSRQRLDYAKNTLQNPNFNKEQHEQRVHQNPNYNKRRYQKKLARLEQLPEKERDAILKRESQQSSQWLINWRERAKIENPKAYEAFLLKARKSLRKHHQAKELQILLGLNQKIRDKL